MICREHNIVFVHIPKTGGTTVEKMMFPNHSFSTDPDYSTLYGWDDRVGWLNHLTMEQMREVCPYRELNEPVVFTIVRNPWDRLVSEYHWKCASSGLQIPFGEFVRLLYLGETEAIKKWYRATIGFDQHIRPQSSYLSPSSEGVVKILRFENFADEVMQMLRQCGIDGELPPRLRASVHAHYTDYYNRCTVDMVGSLYREDRERFGYRYG